MKHVRGNLLTASALGTVLLVVAPTGPLAPMTAASTQEPTTDGYVSGDYGRVRDADDGLSIQRAPLAAREPRPSASATAESSGLNAPIFPGDTIFTAADQRVEVELASGTLVRVGHDSEVTFLALPAPYGTPRDNTVLQLPAGVLRIDARVLDDEEIRVDTPAATFYLADQADARIEVGPRDETELIVRRGVVEVVSDDGSTLVRGGMRTVIAPGAGPAAPTPFNTFTADGFDRWVAQRVAADRYAVRGEEYEALPDEVRPYHRELSVYGDWDYEAEFGFVWSPRTVARDWRPYRHGYWHYGPSGYFWVANENWGWAPYHYGRWVWASSRWAWVPGRVFGGAWVAWSWGSAYVGWAPLDFWNRPVWVSSLVYGYYDPRCWSFVSYNTLAVARVGRPRAYRDVYGAFEVGARLTDSVVVTRAPNLSPEALRASSSARTTAIRVAREDRAAQAALPGRRAPTGASFLEADGAMLRQLGREAAGRPTQAAPPTRLRTSSTPGTASGDRRTADLPARERSPSKATADAVAPESRRRLVPQPSLRPSTRAAPGNAFQRQRTNDPRDLYRRMSERPRTRSIPSSSLQDSRSRSAEPPRARSGAAQLQDRTRKRPEAKPQDRATPQRRATQPSRKKTTDRKPAQNRAKPKSPPAPKKEKPKARASSTTRRPASRSTSSSRRATPRDTSRTRGGRRSGSGGRGET